MYKLILVTLDGTACDRALIEHVKLLAKQAQSRLVLLHVADGWAARTYGEDAVSPEITEDTAYLRRVQAEFSSAEIPTEIQLAYGSPPVEILKAAEALKCDLIAMAGHGHRLFGDIFHGSTITQVRHRTLIPLLLVRTKKE
ncbi:MAG TPA: universal stress protein [Candidatus Acidoferrum sp.]|nr:universal stress protein [Candidatus Acidoferrum sp.]